MKHRGLSQVVTTLMLLVVAILLASSVSYYATNSTRTRTINEDIRIIKNHIWVNGSGALSGFVVQNIGGRDVVLDQITVRGVMSPWSNVFVYRVPSGSSLSGDLNATSLTNIVDGGTVDGNTISAVTSEIPLSSGNAIVVYVKNPGNVLNDDLGTSLGLGVYTTNAQYIKDTNVESLTVQ
jgi:hypothetical protein